MSDRRPGTERPYQTDDEWSRAVLARRTGATSLARSTVMEPGPHPQSMRHPPQQMWREKRGCRALPCERTPLRQGDIAEIDADRFAWRGITNVTFHAASVYQLPYADSSFDAAFACAVLQHLSTPLTALKELRRVLKPGGVIGIADGSSTITFRYPGITYATHHCG
jgi:hypothetical protein